ncbi:MAG: SatD family protein [Thermotogota bacterium]
MRIEAARKVITIDVISSKKERLFSQAIREKLSKLDVKRYDFAPALSRGDEIQCLVAKGENPFSVIREIRFVLLPFKLKIGIGIGEIEIPKVIRDSWDLSGEAFFNARDALEHLKGSDETCVELISGSAIKDLAINSSLILMNVLMNDWTPTQFNYVMSYERFGTYERASTALKVSSQNIHKACKRANWDIIKETEKNLDKLLNGME